VSGCGDAPPPATADLGSEVWGHFVQFVAPSSTGDPADTPCPTPTTTDVAACIASLVQ